MRRPATEIIRNEVVRRIAHSGSATIQDLLRHFRALGLDFVPMPLALSGDREELTYVPGRCYMPTEPRPMVAWHDSRLETLGIMIRRCHDESVAFLQTHRGAEWFPFSEACACPQVVCHNDLGPWNVPMDGDRLGLIDWEMAAPGLRLWDVAHAAWNWVPFFSPRERSRMGATDDLDIDHRLELLLAGYGEPRWTRTEILESVLERQERVLAIVALARKSHAMLLSNWLDVSGRTINEDREFVSGLLRRSRGV